jgi:hypothetical protein
MYTCTELQNLTEDLTIGGNLFLEAPISIDAIRLNVAGSAKFSSLNIQAPAVVFATGDILINNLIVSSPELAPVVLVSTSGKVSIDAYQGPAVLTVISPTEVITPIGSISATIADLNSLIRPLLIRGRMRVFTH